MKRVTELSPHLQQRVNIFFCVKLGWAFGEIKHALELCYPRTILCDRSIHKWINEFWNGQDNIVDKERAFKRRSG